MVHTNGKHLTTFYTAVTTHNPRFMTTTALPPGGLSPYIIGVPKTEPARILSPDSAWVTTQG